MVSVRSVYTTPSSLSYHDLPWIIEHREDRCTLCGRCTSVCPVGAISLSHFRQRVPKLDVQQKKRGNEYRHFTGIRQSTDIAKRCIGCGMCASVCPNEAIGPHLNDNEHRAVFLRNQHGDAFQTRRSPQCPWQDRARPHFL